MTGRAPGGSLCWNHCFPWSAVRFTNTGTCGLPLSLACFLRQKHSSWGLGRAWCRLPFPNLQSVLSEPGVSWRRGQPWSMDSAGLWGPHRKTQNSGNDSFPKSTCFVPKPVKHGFKKINCKVQRMTEKYDDDLNCKKCITVKDTVP